MSARYLGLVPTAEEKIVNGIVFTPMDCIEGSTSYEFIFLNKLETAFHLWADCIIIRMEDTNIKMFTSWKQD